MAVMVVAAEVGRRAATVASHPTIRRYQSQGAAMGKASRAPSFRTVRRSNLAPPATARKSHLPLQRSKVERHWLEAQKTMADGYCRAEVAVEPI